MTKEGNQSGQIALIIILVMVVVGTIALSIVARSVTDLSISTQEENKIRAFSKAEAGIEDILNLGLYNLTASSGQRTVGSGDEQITYDYQIQEIGGGDSYELENQLENGETIQVNLAPGSNPASLKIYWVDGANSQETSGTKASLEISVFSLVGGQYQVRRWALNPPSGAASDNNFDQVGTPPQSFGSKNYEAFKEITLTSDDLFARLKSLYNQTSLGVQAVGGVLPVQAYRLNVAAREGDNNAALEIVQTASSAASVFDYVLWSGSDLAK